MPPLVIAPIVDEIESSEAGSEPFPPPPTVNVLEAVKVDVELVLSPKELKVLADRLCCGKLWYDELFDCIVVVLLTLPLRSFVRSFVTVVTEEVEEDLAPEGGRFVKLVSLVAADVLCEVVVFWLFREDDVAAFELEPINDDADDVEPIIKCCLFFKLH